MYSSKYISSLKLNPHGPIQSLEMDSSKYISSLKLNPALSSHAHTLNHIAIAIPTPEPNIDPKPNPNPDTAPGP